MLTIYVQENIPEQQDLSQATKCQEDLQQWRQLRLEQDVEYEKALEEDIAKVTTAIKYWLTHIYCL